MKAGDTVLLRKESLEWHLVVKALSDKRGPAKAARKLYEETAASVVERARRGDLRRWGAEPAAQLKGRPTKRDRRRIEDLTSPPDES